MLAWADTEAGSEMRNRVYWNIILGHTSGAVSGRCRGAHRQRVCSPRLELSCLEDSECQCRGLTFVPPNLHVEALTSVWRCSESRASKKVIKIKQGYESGSLIQYDSCPYLERKGYQRSICTTQRPWKDTARWPSEGQGERPQEKPTLLTPWS